MKIPIIKAFVSLNQGTAAAPKAPAPKIIRFAQPPQPSQPGEPGKPALALPGVNAAIFKGGVGGIGMEINNVHPELSEMLPEGECFDLVLIPEGGMENWCREQLAEIEAAKAASA